MALKDLIARFFRLERAVRKITPITAVAPLLVSQTGNGLQIRDTRLDNGIDSFDGWVTNAGPNGEADYTDERYWVKRMVVGDGIGGTNNLSFNLEPNDTDAQGKSLKEYPVTVTNLTEMANNTNETNAASVTPTHGLGIGRQVHVWSVYANDRQRYFVMSEADFAGKFVNLTNTSGSGGTCGTTCNFTYTAKPIGGTNTLGTGLTPSWSPNREPNVTLTAATQGLGYFSGTNFTLAMAFENPSSRYLQVVVKEYSCDGAGNLTFVTNWAHVVCGNS